jgi:hypothetical protein
MGLVGGLIGSSYAYAYTMSFTTPCFHDPGQRGYIHAADPNGAGAGLTGDNCVNVPVGVEHTVGEGHSFGGCFVDPSVCMRDTMLYPVIILSGPITLIGHLSLDEYTSLSEIAYVTAMYVSAEGSLTVRFFGGAWPGSLLSVFQTSFSL